MHGEVVPVVYREPSGRLRCTLLLPLRRGQPAAASLRQGPMDDRSEVGSEGEGQGKEAQGEGGRSNGGQEWGWEGGVGGREQLGRHGAYSTSAEDQERNGQSSL